MLLVPFVGIYVVLLLYETNCNINILFKLTTFFVRRTTFFLLLLRLLNYWCCHCPLSYLHHPRYPERCVTVVSLLLCVCLLSIINSLEHYFCFSSAYIIYNRSTILCERRTLLNYRAYSKTTTDEIHRTN